MTQLPLSSPCIETVLKPSDTSIGSPLDQSSPRLIANDPKIITANIEKDTPLSPKKSNVEVESPYVGTDQDSEETPIMPSSNVKEKKGKRPKLKLPSFLTDVTLDDSPSPSSGKNSSGSSSMQKADEDMELILALDKKKRGDFLQKPSKSNYGFDLKIDGITPTPKAQNLNSPNSSSSPSFSAKDHSSKSAYIASSNSQPVSKDKLNKTEKLNKDKSTNETKMDNAKNDQLDKSRNYTKINDDKKDQLDKSKNETKMDTSKKDQLKTNSSEKLKSRRDSHEKKGAKDSYKDKDKSTSETTKNSDKKSHKEDVKKSKSSSSHREDNKKSKSSSSHRDTKKSESSSKSIEKLADISRPSSDALTPSVAKKSSKTVLAVEVVEDVFDESLFDDGNSLNEETNSSIPSLERTDVKDNKEADKGNNNTAVDCDDTSLKKGPDITRDSSLDFICDICQASFDDLSLYRDHRMGCRDSESSQELFKSPNPIIISDQVSSDNDNNQTKLSSIDSDCSSSVADGFKAVEDKDEDNPSVENSSIENISCENTTACKITHTPDVNVSEELFRNV